MVLTIEINNHVKYDQEFSLNHIINNGGSIYQFLSFLDFNDFILELENEYTRKPQYHVKGMLMLAIAYHIHGVGYKKTLKKISKSEKEILDFKEMKIPSPSKLCDFVTKQLTVEKLESFMLKIGFQLYVFLSSKTLLNISHFDSSPIESSRYDKYASYNPHYGCKMYKGHMMMFGTVPLYMKFTNGTTNDKAVMPEFFKKIQLLQMKFHEMNLDAGYDSSEIFANVWKTFDAKPNICVRKDAKINESGTMNSINKLINKAWKQGMNVRKPINEKLDYIYNRGKTEVVGSYFRNQIIEGGQGYSYHFRGHQERTHCNMKKTVKFDVRYVHNKNKELHSLWSFISYQLLCLTALQNNLKTDSFGFIF